MLVYMPLLIPLLAMLPDAGGPIIAFAAFGVAGLIILPVIVIAESIVMALMKWGTFGRCLVDAIIMNLVSSLFGLIGLCGLVFYYRGPQLAVPTEIGWLLFLLLTWAISVAIEAVVLLLLKRHPRRQTWLTALASNTASYALLLVVALVFLTSQGGLGL